MWSMNPWSMNTNPMLMQQKVVQKSVTPLINRANTTIIADVRLALMRSDDSSWTVQIAGNVSFAQCKDLVRNLAVIVNGKKYIFIAVGSNQIYQAKQSVVQSDIHQLIDIINCKNSGAKIFLLPVLPRLFDNEYAKAYIIEFNKGMATAVKGLDKMGLPVKFLPIQNSFIVNGLPQEQFFEKDQLTLSVMGCKKLKHLAFAAAGFKSNV